MKKLSLFLFTLLALFLYSCNTPNEPDAPPTGGTPSAGVAPTVNFSIKKTSPFTIQFTNQSRNATSYEWDFGDGSTSSTVSPEHTYRSEGTYTVRLIARNGTLSKELTKRVTISKPTLCYVVGYRYDRVGLDNKYYYARLEDSGPFVKETWFTTQYTRISQSDLPKSYRFTTPVLLENIHKHDYYTIYVYWSDNTAGTATQRLKQTIYRDSEMYSTYPSEITKRNDNGDTQITLFLEWK